MDERLCGVCGAAAAAGETVCAECGAPLPPEAEREAVPSGRAEPPEPGKPRRPLPRGLLGAAAALAIAALAAVWGFLLWRDAPLPDQFPTSQSRGVIGVGTTLITPEGIYRLPGLTQTDGDSCLYSDAWLLGLAVSEELEEGFYALYDGRTLELQPWHAATLSGDGRYVFYVADAGAELALCRRELDTGETLELERGSWEAVGDLAAAFDGSALAYTVGSPAPWQWTGTSVTGQVRLWSARAGLSDAPWAGDLRPALGRDGGSWLVYQQVGDETPERAAYRVRSSLCLPGKAPRELEKAPIVDRDVEEAIYQDGDGTWYYEAAGVEPTALELPCEMTLLTAAGAGVAGGNRLDRLTDWVYLGTDESGRCHVFSLDARLRVRELAEVEDGAGLRIDPCGRRLAYLWEGDVFLIEHPLRQPSKPQNISGTGWDSATGRGTVIDFSADRALEHIYYTLGRGQVWLAGERPRLLYNGGGSVLHAPRLTAMEGGGLYVQDGVDLFFVTPEGECVPVISQGSLEIGSVTPVGDGSRAVWVINRLPKLYSGWAQIVLGSPDIAVRACWLEGADGYRELSDLPLPEAPQAVTLFGRRYHFSGTVGADGSGEEVGSHEDAGYAHGAGQDDVIIISSGGTLAAAVSDLP